MFQKHIGACNLKTYTFEESEIEKMEEHIQNPDLPPTSKAFFHIALANAKEKQKKFGEAWYHFFTGNELRRQSEIYDSVTTQVTHEPFDGNIHQRLC
ncbi:MAG: hypothetical protein Ct9H90mP13_06100 [Pseudomonadota bacterium]|nr:MAG: hypothetical protein Ct9H90mP13_06100 [Pseudomonadota bacterium]